MIGILAGTALASLGICAAELLFPSPSLADKIKTAIRNYDIACETESDESIAAKASSVAALYREANDAENYRVWAEMASSILALRGTDTTRLDPALRARIEGPQRTDTMGELQRKWQHQRGSEPSADVETAPPAQPKTYTYEEKQQMRADLQKQQDDEARKKAEDDSEVILQKQQAKRDAIKAAAQKEKFKVAIESSPYRRWMTLGGKEASEARIVACDDGTLTIEKRDGKRVDLKESRLSPADKKYLDTWKEGAGLAE